MLGAFADVYQAASHPAVKPVVERMEFSREDAAFAVNTLTFIIDYVARILNSQGLSEN
ncbi:MAG TPA: hypothetical protein VH393_05340 [Ktedonobacterales bacterium]